MNSDVLRPQPKAEKKWFVFVGDRHHGPFAADEIQNYLKEGTLGSRNFIWSAGMAKWRRAEEVSQFELFSKHTPESYVTEWTMRSDFVETESSENLDAVDAELSTLSKPQQENRVLETPSALVGMLHTAAKTADQFRSQAVDQIVENYKNKKLWAAAAATVGLLVFLLFLFLRANAAFMLPTYEDLTREENREIRAAVEEPIKSQGPNATVAMSSFDSIRPSFVIGSNLYDGTRLDVFIQGVPQTLLGLLDVSVHVPVTIRGGVARTPPFKQEDDQPFPRGEYWVSITCTDCPHADKSLNKKSESDTLVLAQKKFFIGGANDRDYQTRLSLYHQKLRFKAQNEIAEVKQVLDTLANQLEELTQQFQTILQATRREPLDRVQRWNEFFLPWSQIEDQLAELSTKWTPEYLQKNVFYVELYTDIKRALDHFKRTQENQNTYMISGKVDNATEIQIVSDTSLVQSALHALRLKTSILEKLFQSSQGMPSRDSR